MIFEKDRLKEGRKRYSLKNSAFKEEDHPRGEDGRFGTGGKSAEEKDSKEKKVNDPKKEYDDVVSKYKGTEKWMKSPNGSQTKLNEKQWVQTRTSSFKNWFGDFENDPENASKAVDENGDPLIVYHGTNSEIQEFDTDFLGKSSVGGAGTDYGFFFAESKNHAQYWADNASQNNGGEPIVKELFLNVRNVSFFSNENDGGLTLEDGIKTAFEEEKDGCRVDNIIGDDDSGEARVSWIVFDPSKIKSATENSGMFDSADNKIANSKGIKVYRASR